MSILRTGAEQTRRPLARAASEGHTEVVTFLLDHGAQVNALEPYGDSALLGAVLGGHRQTARALILRGADVNVRSKYGTSILDAAHESRIGDIEAMLLERGAKP